MTTSPDPYSSIVGESVSRPTAWPAGFCPFPVFSELRCSCLLDCTRGVGDRVLARQQDDAAHQDEDQEQHERDEVENEPERGDGGIRTGVISSPGQAEPYSRTPRDGKGSFRSTLRADPCRPGEPGVAQRVPDRGDDAKMWLGPVWAEHECEHAQREDS